MRSEARLPVGLVRVRAFLPKASTIEGVVVPVFRAGRFDQLDEPSSPFNLAANATYDIDLQQADNVIGTFAGVTLNGPISIRNALLTPLTIGSVAGVNGITATNNSVSSGDKGVQANIKQIKPAQAPARCPAQHQYTWYTRRSGHLCGAAGSLQ